MSPRGVTRSASGAVLPTRLMVLSISTVALGGLVFFATQGDDEPSGQSGTSITGSPSTAPITEGPGGPTATPPAPTPSASASASATPKPPKPVVRSKVEVLVLNNTNRTGFAGTVRSRAEKFGWNVVDTGNWQGSVDATTVYYGPGMERAARLLAADLEIKSVKKLFETDDLSSERLNVILTDDYS